MSRRNYSGSFSDNRFVLNQAALDHPRSTFQRGFNHKTTFSVGQLIPLFVDEVLPGDTFSVSASAVLRMTTALKPVMDILTFRVEFFAVPFRILWNHFKEFWGENTQGHWVPSTTYTIPQIVAPSDGWGENSLMDYMGVQPKAGSVSTTHLPVRAYCMIWNEWYRDQNLQDPVNITFGDATITGVHDVTDRPINAQKGTLVLPVNKEHDYFTSCLPAPQKGPAVSIGLTGNANVITLPSDNSSMATGEHPAVRWRMMGGLAFAPGQHNLVVNNNTPDNHAVGSGMVQAVTTTPINTHVAVPSNLWADMSSVSMATINQLRQGFQIQKFLERAARGGTRLVESIRAHFGVISPDARQQRPEFLGSFSTLVGSTQVVQTSGSLGEPLVGTPQANVAGFTHVNAGGHCFTKSFTEPCYIIGVGHVRPKHTYQTGTERMWFRTNLYDFYFPEFANIGEQPVYQREIYTSGGLADTNVFGYQEAYADYRYKPSRISGMFRSSSSAPLDYWHFGDKYDGSPLLSDAWITETPLNVDRTLAVSYTKAPQILCDISFSNLCTRCMPIHSTPGLIDHH